MKTLCCRISIFLLVLALCFPCATSGFSDEGRSAGKNSTDSGDFSAESAVFSSRMLFPLHPQHNHAPGLAELSDGELIASWYRGSGERSADDVAVYGARLKPGQNDWGPEFLMADTPGFPDCNTALFVDPNGRLMLFWPVIIANSWESCLTHLRISEYPEGVGCPQWDHDQILLLKPADFSIEASQKLDEVLGALSLPLPERQQRSIAEAREKLSDKLYQRLGWQPRCKPTRLPSGRMLLPLYTDTFSLSLMAISDDDGRTWFAGKPTLGFGAIQPAVLRRDDGTLVAYMRENGFTGHIRFAESRDEGVTWGDVGITNLPNPGSGLDGIRLRNGHWVLVHNDLPSGRNRLAVSLSVDEGRSWTFVRHLEDQPAGAFHYPCIIQSSDGLIHCVYSYFCSEGKSMKHVTFNEQWIRDGAKPASSP